MTTISHEVHVLAEREAFEAWIRDLPDNRGFGDGCAWLLSKYDDGRYQWKETHDGWRAWLARAALSTADAERREVVGLMREAADNLWSKGFSRTEGSFVRCSCCDVTALGVLQSAIQHESYCLVTKLRAAADRANGGQT